MRTKTLNQIAQEAAKYAGETLDIERGSHSET
jgi:phage gp46-like protein